MDIALAIESLIPGAKYQGSVTANTKASYTKLTWLDASDKPTWAQIQEADAALPAPQTQEEITNEFKTSFQAAGTTTQKIAVIARKLRLV